MELKILNRYIAPRCISKSYRCYSCAIQGKNFGESIVEESSVNCCDPISSHFSLQQQKEMNKHISESTITIDSIAELYHVPTESSQGNNFILDKLNTLQILLVLHLKT
jgi:hypothetical protein